MSVLRVKRRRGVAPRIRTKRSTDADSASVMEGSPTVEKLQGMSLRDQDDRGTSDIEPTPSDRDGEFLRHRNRARRRPRHRPRVPPSPPSGRSFRPPCATGRAGWPVRFRPSSAVAEPVGASPPAAVAEPTPELPEEMPDAMIRPYSPPDWKAVFGDQEEDAAERHADDGEDAADERPSEEPDTVEAEARLAPNLSYLGNDISGRSRRRAGPFRPGLPGIRRPRRRRPSAWKTRLDRWARMTSRSMCSSSRRALPTRRRPRRPGGVSAPPTTSTARPMPGVRPRNRRRRLRTTIRMSRPTLPTRTIRIISTAMTSTAACRGDSRAAAI